MLTLLVAVMFGILSAIFATQNTGFVSLTFANYTIPRIPIYLAILVPLLIGLLLALVFHVAKDLSQNLTISEQKDKIKKLKIELAETTKTAHKFEVEKVKLKAENGEPEDENSL